MMTELQGKQESREQLPSQLAAFPLKFLSGSFSM